MNKLQLIQQRNNIKNLIRVSNRQFNCLRWSSNESWNHLVMKFRICHYLKNKGIEFCSEAIFNDGQRCDVLNIDEGTCLEVYETEKIEKTNKNYPLPVIFVKANQKWNEKLIL